MTYVEGDRPVTPLLETSNTASRGAEAVATLDGPDGTDLDGSGVSIAVIDSGIDGTHPFFRQADGSSKVARNLKSACLFLQFGDNDTCFLDVPGNDSDTASLGGHGTHVAGIAAGVPVVLADGSRLQGAAPGATLIGLSVGQAISVYGGDSGLNWVLDHDTDPCGDGSCPPIKVTNNSYGVGGGSDVDPNSATVKLQRALAAQGDSALAACADIESACRLYLPICATGLAPAAGGDYSTISGTSMATPHVAGIVAQLFEKNPAATPAAVERALVDGAHAFADGAAYEADPRGGLTSFDKGHGLVDVVRSSGLIG